MAGNPNWKQGISANPGGRPGPALKQLTNDLRKVVAQNPDKVRKISEHILEQACEGELAYIQLLYDRLDGKAAQTTEVEHTMSPEMSDVLKRMRELKRRDRTATDITPVIADARIKG